LARREEGAYPLRYVAGDSTELPAMQGAAGQRGRRLLGSETSWRSDGKGEQAPAETPPCLSYTAFVLRFLGVACKLSRRWQNVKREVPMHSAVSKRGQTVIPAAIRKRYVIEEGGRLDRKLEDLEKRFDEQFQVVFEAIRQLMLVPVGDARQIGFQAARKGT
jgi:bifunctional DNA-binding transcriptional regulator/antitoxin component of YhaV-PrlF toxin-antitoxin module